jgi:hypothetical protein
MNHSSKALRMSFFKIVIDWRNTPIISTLGRRQFLLKQKDHEFETSLGYIASLRPAWTTYGDPVLNKSCH